MYKDAWFLTSFVRLLILTALQEAGNMAFSAYLLLVLADLAVIGAGAFSRESDGDEQDETEHKS